MNVGELLRISIRSLRSNMLRSFLTMLGIIIGVATVIAMISIGQGTSKQVTSQIQSLGSNLITVTAGSGSSTGTAAGGSQGGSTGTLNISDADPISKIDTVKYVAPVSQVSAQLLNGSNTASATIIGSTPGYADIKSWETDIGRFFTEDEVNDRAKVVVLGATTAETLFGEAGFDAVGSMIKINNIPFRVIGVLKAKGSSGTVDQDDTVIAPITTIQSRFQTGSSRSSVRQILVEAKSTDVINSTMALIQYTMRQSHKLGGADDDFRVQSQEDVMSSAESVTKTLTLFLGGVAAISLLVGGIGIMNIMLVSVTERTREIGIRKAIGAKEGTILSQFLFESVTLAILGGVIGVILGFGGSKFVGKLMDVTTAVSMNSVLLAVGFSACIGIVFGVFPARQAAKLDPIEALRYE
ncbi:MULTISPECIES: ABC transporter permease [Paenibacillus]|uniref:Multidrug ABC transporter substrate-binding protein n=2 Tax=Paenibacillus TaxID=44249 RepID=A0A1R1F2F8_9BACL|nr:MULTISPECIES: ABC transporter permease [Paenibacillus]MCM2997674.1 ABC transporter permease [Paenibacillus cellulositrophicus]OMF58210.1 multidrug ABC transporter substrate-binding protein [Paenibacillus rhizosphaerae]UYO03368.1 ABC transporter permease [Paenibacillus sp. PSB04]GIO53469.1 multidrug ABC transporter substrate-binding protein [Paenibacillus cineris]